MLSREGGLPGAVRGRPHSGWSVAAVALYGLLVVARAPGLVTAPRFWAEEGSVYYRDALMHGVRSLAMPHQGYFSILPNAAALLAASTVGPEHAPFVTTALAVLLQCLPAAIVMTSNARIFASGWSRAAALALLLLAPGTGETWMNTTNAQFHATVAAALCLVELPEDLAGRPRRRIFLRGVLAVAALSGPVPAFLLPAFLVRAVRVRGEAAVHAGIVGAGIVVQGLEAALSAGDPHAPARFVGVLPELIPVAAFVKNVVAPFAGSETACDVGGWFVEAAARRDAVYPAACGGVTLFLCALLFGLTRGGGIRTLLATGYVAVVVPTYALAFVPPSDGSYALVAYPGCADRYAYVPGVLLALLLLDHCRTSATAPRWAPWVARVVVAAVLVRGVMEYRAGMDAFVDSSFPRWTDEVALHARDPSYAPRVWPPRFRVEMR